jgi:hypothetical protein
MGDGEGALSDALRCRMLRPKWAKACYRQGAAHMLLKVSPHCHRVHLFMGGHILATMFTYLLLILCPGHIP